MAKKAVQAVAPPPPPPPTPPPLPVVFCRESQKVSCELGGRTRHVGSSLGRPLPLPPPAHTVCWPSWACADLRVGEPTEGVVELQGHGQAGGGLKLDAGLRSPGVTRPEAREWPRPRGALKSRVKRGKLAGLRGQVGARDFSGSRVPPGRRCPALPHLWLLVGECPGKLWSEGRCLWSLAVAPD